MSATRRASGETQEISLFASKITIFHCFSPKNHCFAQVGVDADWDPDGGDRSPSDFQMAASPYDDNSVAFGAFVHDV